MAALHGVILDIDGTLIDSNDAHAQAWVDALVEAGIEVPFERVRPLIGMGADNLLPEVSGIEKDTPEGKQISQRRSAIFKERYLQQIQAFPQTRALLQHMRDNGLRLVIATSAQPDELDQLLAIAGVADLIEQQTSSGDAKNSKPDPDIVQVALQRLGCAPGEALMLGDTPYDVEAAGKAGVATIALRCGGHNDETLEGAIARYNDPADLLAHYDQSPLVHSLAR